MVFNQDCDFVKDTEDCMLCYRYESCKEYYSEHPEKIFCADDMKQQLQALIN